MSAFFAEGSLLRSYSVWWDVGVLFSKFERFIWVNFLNKFAM